MFRLHGRLRAPRVRDPGGGVSHHLLLQMLEATRASLEVTERQLAVLRAMTPEPHAFDNGLSFLGWDDHARRGDSDTTTGGW